MTSARLHNARAQRGVATLVVVMVLFFIISLVAAYTNRNLLFEQRTSANQYRSTQSHEAAQAGIEWAVAMLNSGRITTACTPSTSAGDTNFRQRYLTIGANGVISANASASGSVPYLSARCVFNGNGWNCDCPADGTPAPTVPTGAGAFPAYGMRFVSLTGTPPPGVIRLETIACARYDDACLDFNNNEGDEGRTRMAVLVALYSSIKTPPGAAVTAQHHVSGDDTGQAVNSNQAAGGVAIQAGGSVAGVKAVGPAGTPSAAAIVGNDTSLSGLLGASILGGTDASYRMFATYFGLPVASYPLQPGTIVLDDCPCSDTDLRNAVNANPGRPIWVNGDLNIDSSGAVGAASDPVTVIVSGNVTATAAVDLYGVLWGNINGVPATNWTINGPLTVHGAAGSNTSVNVITGASLVYDRDLLDTLRKNSGSFVVVPGSWKDY